MHCDRTQGHTHTDRTDVCDCYKDIGYARARGPRVEPGLLNLTGVTGWLGRPKNRPLELLSVTDTGVAALADSGECRPVACGSLPFCRLIYPARYPGRLARRRARPLASPARCHAAPDEPVQLTAALATPVLRLAPLGPDPYRRPGARRHPASLPSRFVACRVSSTCRPLVNPLPARTDYPDRRRSGPDLADYPPQRVPRRAD